MSKELEAIVAEMRKSLRESNATNTHLRLHGWADRLESLSTQAGEGWRDIATAPKDGSYILASDGERDGCAVVRWDCDGWVYAWHEYDGPMQMHSASHWRPLPSPPSDTKGEG